MKSDKPSPIFSGASPEEIKQAIETLATFTPEGKSLPEVQQLLNELLIPHLMNYNHPGFQSLFNVSPEDGAKMGARLALEYNQGVTNYQVSPGGSMLEEVCCQRLCKLFGLPETAEATFMYSGTYANQQAIYMAICKKAEQHGFDYAEKGISGFKDPKRLKVIASAEAHFSLRQALRMLGLGEQALVTIPTDNLNRISFESIESAIGELDENDEVVLVHITTGTSSTGSVEPLKGVAELCRKHKAWFHADGAYGFAYKLVPEVAELFEGIEEADSITWDPHKQLHVPIPNSVLFIKDAHHFDYMSVFSSYFNRKETVPNPGLKSAPSTRPLAALPVVSSLLYRGLDKVKEDLSQPIKLVRTFYDYLKDQPDIQLLHEPHLGVVCFQLVPEGFPENKIDTLQEFLYEQTLHEGKFIISKTKVGERSALRLLILSQAVSLISMIEMLEHTRGKVEGFKMSS